MAHGYDLVPTMGGEAFGPSCMRTTVVWLNEEDTAHGSGPDPAQYLRGTRAPTVARTSYPIVSVTSAISPTLRNSSS